MVNGHGKRAVVTGLGVVAPNGIGKEQFWEANCQGLSGIFPIESFDVTPFRTKIAAQVRSFCPDDFIQGHLASKMDRFSQFAVAASKMAREDSGMRPEQEDPCRAGIVLGSFGDIYGITDFSD